MYGFLLTFIGFSWIRIIYSKICDVSNLFGRLIGVFVIATVVTGFVEIFNQGLYYVNIIINKNSLINLYSMLYVTSYTLTISIFVAQFLNAASNIEKSVNILLTSLFFRFLKNLFDFSVYVVDS